MHAGFIVVLSFFSVSAVAQDAALMQQQQVQQQVSLQQQMDLINRQQQAIADLNLSLAGYRLGAQSPRLKQEQGTQPGTILVTMKDRTRGATIFYTTDGWTPTAASHRYMGPIAVDQSVRIQAIALTAGGVRSRTSILPVVVPSSVPNGAMSDQVRVSKLVPGTRLPLMFSASVSSSGQSVGSHLPVVLAKDLYVDGRLAAHKGAAVETLVTQVDTSHVQGLPGVLSFSAQSLRLQDGTIVPLSAVKTMEGPDRTVKADIASIVPLGGLAVHGGDAIIPSGAKFEADVALIPGETAGMK